MIDPRMAHLFRRCSSLWLLLVCVATTTTTTRAFVVVHPRARQVVLSSTETEGLTRDADADVYRKLGIIKDELALGINPEEVLEYIGTREDVIEKTIRDIPDFDTTKAGKEVDKFFMDAEAVNMYIQFQKMKADDPDFSVPEDKSDEEGFFSFRTFIFAYLGYVVFNLSKTFLRRYIGEQEVAGTWHDTGVGFFDDWVTNTSPKAVSLMDQTADAAANSGAGEAASDLLQNLSP